MDRTSHFCLQVYKQASTTLCLYHDFLTPNSAPSCFSSAWSTVIQAPSWSCRRTDGQITRILTDGLVQFVPSHKLLVQVLRHFVIIGTSGCSSPLSLLSLPTRMAALHVRCFCPAILALSLSSYSSCLRGSDGGKGTFPS